MTDFADEDIVWLVWRKIGEGLWHATVFQSEEHADYKMQKDREIYSDVRKRKYVNLGD